MEGEHERGENNVLGGRVSGELEIYQREKRESIMKSLRTRNHTESEGLSGMPRGVKRGRVLKKGTNSVLLNWGGGYFVVLL